MAQAQTFPCLILIARPAAGKSEIIHFLEQTPLIERIERYHIGELEEIDDFPMIWAWFEEDAILSEMGMPRLHSDESGYFLDNHLWDVLIRRIDLEYDKLLRDAPGGDLRTVLIEFSRGQEHGGYREAFRYLSDAILRQAVILYVDVSHAESLRKNRARFNPACPDSILHHALDDKKLKRLYREDDWREIATASEGVLEIKGHRVPYAVFPNEDDVTTHPGSALAERLEAVLAALWGCLLQIKT